MTKLLSAGFTRLFKNKILWLLCAVMFSVGIFTVLKTDTDYHLNKVFFIYAAVIGIAAAVFVSLFTGTEYSDGCIRNKLIIGHLRGSVYLSNLIVSLSAALMMVISNLIPVLSIGMIRLNGFDYGAKTLLPLVAVSLVMTLAYVSVFTLIAMLVTNKAYSAVACIILSFMLLFAGVVINSRLQEPEYYEGYSYTLNGVEFSAEQEPNPNYISGNFREFVEKLYDILPSGQAIQLNTGDVDKPLLFMAYSAAITVITTGLGFIIFRKKDLK